MENQDHPATITFYNGHDAEPVAEQNVTIHYRTCTSGEPYLYAEDDAVELAARMVWPDADNILAYTSTETWRVDAVRVWCDGEKTVWPVEITLHTVPVEQAA